MLVSSLPLSETQHLAHRVDAGAERRLDQVGIALGGSDLGVAEQLANHLKRGAARNEQ